MHVCVSVCECVLLGWGSVLVCSLSPHAPHALPSWLEVGSVCVRWNRDGRGGEGRGSKIREHTPEPGCRLAVEGVPKGQ